MSKSTCCKISGVIQYHNYPCPVLLYWPISSSIITHILRGRRGCDRMVVGYTTTCTIMPIITKVVSSKPVHGEVYSMQHYAIKFVSYLRQVGGIHQVQLNKSAVVRSNNGLARKQNCKLIKKNHHLKED